MKRVSVKIPADMVETLDSKAESKDTTRSDVIRNLLDDALNPSDDDRNTELQQRITDLERENERLRNEKRTLIRDREERTELVRYVEEQRELTRYQERRQRLLDDANILRRWKWKLTGVPVDPDDE
jgi:metal-responsive CopG/Arc/MetJ family transcriptional regulator